MIFEQKSQKDPNGTCDPLPLNGMSHENCPFFYPSLTWQASYQPRRRFPSNPPQHLDINICFRCPGRQSSKGALLVRRPPITTSNQEHDEFRFSATKYKIFAYFDFVSHQPRPQSLVLHLPHIVWSRTTALPMLACKETAYKMEYDIYVVDEHSFSFLGELTVFTRRFSVVSYSLVFPF